MDPHPHQGAQQISIDPVRDEVLADAIPLVGTAATPQQFAYSNLRNSFPSFLN